MKNIIGYEIHRRKKGTTFYKEVLWSILAVSAMTVATFSGITA